MTAYVTIPDSDLDPDSPLTTALVTAFRDNLIAFSERATGSPTPVSSFIDVATMIAPDLLTQAELAANSVGQSELKTTTASQSVTVPASGSAAITLTGGINTTCHFQGGGNDCVGHSGTYAAQVRARDPSSAGGTLYVYSQYVQASPPYDLGDGEVPLFVFAMIENGSGRILGTYAAEDPPWAYHGPTIITPHRIDQVTRKGYRNVTQYQLDNPGWQASIATADLATKRQMLADHLSSETVEIEITADYKNSDMDLVPHLFGDVPADASVYMLDPVSDIMQELAALHTQIPYSEIEGNSISELLTVGNLIVDNVPVARGGPAGIQVMPVNWR